MKVDATKIREIARRLGVSERTVEEYLLDRLTMQQAEGAPGATLPTEVDRPGVVDLFGHPLESEAG